MKRKILLTLSIFLVALGLFLLTLIIFSFKNVDRGGLQISSNVESRVYLDGKEIGKTPLCKCEKEDTISTGNYEIKLEPIDKSYPIFTTRAKINGGVSTVIDRTFLPDSLASSYTLTLEKIGPDKSELIVNSLPEGAIVTIDGSPLDATPFKSTTLKVGEHEIEIQKRAFAKKTIRVKTTASYRLIVDAQLGTENSEGIGINSESQEATKSAEVNLDQTPVEKKVQIKITSTPNGFLRVRSGSGTTFEEVARVNTGETFEVMEEENGWYKITTADGIEGWIISDYTEEQ